MDIGRLTSGDVASRVSGLGSTGYISSDLAAISELLEKRLDEDLRLVSLETNWMPTNEDDTLVKQSLTLVMIHDI